MQLRHIHSHSGIKFRVKASGASRTVGDHQTEQCNFPPKNRVMVLYLLNLGDAPVRDPGNGSGLECVFSRCGYFFYSLGLNFDSSEMIHINIHN